CVERYRCGCSVAWACWSPSAPERWCRRPPSPVACSGVPGGPAAPGVPAGSISRRTSVLLREIADVPLTLGRQYGSRAGLRRYQLRRINRLLAYAGEKVPYYRGSLRASVLHPLSTLDDLAGLPLLPKQTLRSRPNRDFVADGVDTGACLTWSTS